MDPTELMEVAAYLQQRLKVERPDPDEFTTTEFIVASGLPRSTADRYLMLAEEEKIVKSRKLSRARYWRIVDREKWQEYLKTKGGAA
jgi:hypothetical protein